MRRSDISRLDVLVNNTMTKFMIIILSGLTCLLISGCLVRGDGLFKKVGDSDYKARINLMDLFIVADGSPTYVCGTVLLEDHITPLKNTHITLVKNNDKTIVANAYTDHTGSFVMSGIFKQDTYAFEVDSPEYLTDKEIIIEPGKNKGYEIIVHKK